MPRDRVQVRVYYTETHSNVIPLFKPRAVTVDVEMPVQATNITALELLIDDMSILRYPFSLTEEFYVRMQPEYEE